MILAGFLLLTGTIFLLLIAYMALEAELEANKLFTNELLDEREILEKSFDDITNLELQGHELNKAAMNTIELQNIEMKDMLVAIQTYETTIKLYKDMIGIVSPVVEDNYKN